MNCKVKKQAFFGATIALLLSGTALLYMSNREALAVLSMIIFVIDFISLKKANGRYITIGSIFLSLIYFFHCGQSIVELCGYLGNVKNSENLTLILSNAELAESLLFCIFSITFYTLGAILNTDCQIVSSSEKSYIIDVKQCTQLRALGLILLLLSFGPRVYSDVLKWQAYIAGAYINTTFVEVSGLVSILNQFFLFSLVLLVIGNANNPRVARSILYLSIIYMIFCMLKGNRGQQIIAIIVLVFLYFRLVNREKVKISSFIYLVLLGYIFLVFINIIGTIRSSGAILSVSGFWRVLKDNSPIAMIMKMLAELGGSDLNLGYAIRYIPSTHSYNFGLNYLAGLTAIYPNVGELLGRIPNYYSYLHAFPVEVIKYMGGSILGEAYVNFGMIGGVLFIGLVGYFVNKLSQRFDSACLNKNDVYKVAIMMALIPNLLLWTRDYFSCMVFQFFWMWVMISLVRKSRKAKMVYE